MPPGSPAQPAWAQGTPGSPGAVPGFPQDTRCGWDLAATGGPRSAPLEQSQAPEGAEWEGEEAGSRATTWAGPTPLSLQESGGQRRTSGLGVHVLKVGGASWRKGDSEWGGQALVGGATLRRPDQDPAAATAGAREARPHCCLRPRVGVHRFPGPQIPLRDTLPRAGAQGAPGTKLCAQMRVARAAEAHGGCRYGRARLALSVHKGVAGWVGPPRQLARVTPPSNWCPHWP